MSIETKEKNTLSQRAGLRQRMMAQELLCGTFIKTPAHEIVEVLSMAGLDFLCLDAEHAPFDRARLDACLAVARALDMPTLVRVASGAREELLKVLDAGATGIVVPHVDSVQKAREIAQWARFGHGGRGYAGSTRWAGFTSRKMPDLLQQSQSETIVIAQIEEPEGVEVCEQIASVNGIDGLFVGPADLAVCLGVTDLNDPKVLDAMERVGKAVQGNDCSCMTFTPDTGNVNALRSIGVNMFFISSEHGFMLSGAKNAMVHMREQK